MGKRTLKGLQPASENDRRFAPRNENNGENPPHVIIAACRRALEWVTEDKLRKALQANIERQEARL